MSDLSEIDALLQQGVAAHQQKRYEDAERCYRTIIQSQPTNPGFFGQNPERLAIIKIN